MTDKLFAIPPIPTIYNGVKFRSRVEARWAVFFDALGLRAEYEADGFNIREGAYLPDFWLPQIRMFFEIKGAEPTREEVQKCADLALSAECDILIAAGTPEERFQIRWCGVDGEHEGLFVLAHDRYADAGFWLVGEEHSHSIGPKSCVPGGPTFTAMERAYEMARSHRFEGRSRRVAPIGFPRDTHDGVAA